MNETVSKFLFLSLKCVYNSLDLPTVLVGQFLKNNEKYKKFKKQDIQDTFIKKNWIKPTFNMIWPASDKV